MKNKSLLFELWDFLKIRKVWWLTPIIILLILVSILIIFGQSSALSPFIYALFWATTITIEDDKVKVHPPEKAFKKPGTTIKPLTMEEVKIDVLDCLEKIHDIQHNNYPSELPVKKIVVLQTIEEGQVYNVTYVTSGLKTLNIKMDSRTGEVKSEKLEQVFKFGKWFFCLLMF